MILVAAYILLVAGSLVGLVRAVSAAFSSRVRSSIARHPIIHGVWFIIAAVVICDLLIRVSASIGPRPSPNQRVEPMGASHSAQLQFERQRRLAPTAHAHR